MKTHSLKWSNSPREKEPNKKQEKVLPSDNNSPNRTDYPRETKPGEKKGKVLPSDNNSPFRLLHKFQSKFQLRKIILISQHYTDKACSRVLIGLTANRETTKKKVAIILVVFIVNRKDFSVEKKTLRKLSITYQEMVHCSGSTFPLSIKQKSWVSGSPEKLCPKRGGKACG